MSERERIIALLNQSHSPYQVVENLVNLFKGEFRIEKESNLTSLKAGDRFCLTRNQTSFAAVRLPKKAPKAFKIVATHNDSPTFKLKPNPLIQNKGVVQLNVEPYGGMLMAPWFDRPLSFAGRIVYEKDGVMASKLVDIDEDLLVIPNLCIHMNREANSGHAYNPAKELVPVFGVGEMKPEEFAPYLLEKAGLEGANLLSHDLFLYVREPARIVGKDQSLLMSPRLDDLSSAYSAALAFEGAPQAEDIAEIFISFDNEEVGSLTRQGAFSGFMKDLVDTVCEIYQFNALQKKEVIARSFLFSVDNAHAFHPNYPEISDKTTDVRINGGVVIKYNANAKYTSDAISAAYAKTIAKQAEVAYQEYTNRSDMKGGGTLGNLSNAEISLNCADIGIAQWAMHSCMETQGLADLDAMVKFLGAFYASETLPLE